MLFREALYEPLASVFAGKISGVSIAVMVAALSVSAFAGAERQSFNSWAEFYYGDNYRALAGKKVVKLPPVDDLTLAARLEQTADDDFTRSLRNGSVWRSRGSKNASKYIRTVKSSNLIGSDGSFFDPFQSLYSRKPGANRIPQSGLYRTMCVRSCDGYMWPISFSTTTANFDVDENVCRSSCAAPTRLYYYENPGQEPDQMVDRRGRSYNLLPTAWRYKKQHVSSCKCRPDPWEPQAMARHAKYAVLKQQGKLKR
ncbi:MAG: DUF2865 domain-containing protein, partial [Methyloligellaceae bacterium]